MFLGFRFFELLFIFVSVIQFVPGIAVTYRNRISYMSAENWGGKGQ